MHKNIWNIKKWRPKTIQKWSVRTCPKTNQKTLEKNSFLVQNGIAQEKMGNNK